MIYNWSIAGRELSMTFSKTLLAMLPYFALGMLGALLAHGRTIGMPAKRRLIAAGVALVLADAIIKAAAPAAGIDATVPFSIMRDLPSAIGFALVVAAFAIAPRSAVLGGRVLPALGMVSYGVYLWHVPVSWSARPWAASAGSVPGDRGGAPSRRSRWRRSAGSSSSDRRALDGRARTPPRARGARLGGRGVDRTPAGASGGSAGPRSAQCAPSHRVP